MSTLLPVIVIGVFFWVFLLFKDKWIAKFRNPEYERKYNLAIERFANEYDQIFAKYIDDKEALAWVKNIVDDPKITGILVTKKQRSIASSLGGAALAGLTGVVKVEVETLYYLVLGEKGIYNIQVDENSLQGQILKFFPNEDIKAVNVKKWNMFDDLKQAQKLKLSGGGTSWDGADNSDLKKVVIELVDEKNEEFFCYEVIRDGKIGANMLAWGKDLDLMDEDGVVEQLLWNEIPKKTFEKLTTRFHGTLTL